jgi:uroporphyrinogen-III decarboxylase
MTPQERLYGAMSGHIVDRVPFVPKIWVDLAANLTGVELPAVIQNPLLAMKVIIDAGVLVGADAVRQFIFPPRKTEQDGEKVYEVDAYGHRLGEIDMPGGLATHLFDPTVFQLDSLFFMAHQNFWKAVGPFVNDLADVAKIVVPPKAYYEENGYGDIQREMIAYAGNRVALIGDCDSATLAFYAGLRGVEQSLLDFYMNPQLVRAAMEKGVARSIERGKFSIDVGLRVLRLNDSMANMTLISPEHWREFIFPHFKTVCDELHHYCPGVKIYCHICGNVLPIIDDLLQTGLDCIAPLDPLGEFTVAEARAVAGDGAVLMGGVNTISFIQSTPEQIAGEARRCMAEGCTTDGRFILGSGCVIPRSASAEMIRAVSATAQTFGIIHEGH